jgi:hypothetical protein
MAFGSQQYKPINCIICNNVFIPKFGQQRTCSDQCKIKSYVIDYSDPSKCWIFKILASESRNIKFNYGHLWENGKFHPAHRISYRAFNGPLIDGKFICHSCDVPSCVNPNHLFQASPKSNMDDAANKRRLGSQKWLIAPYAKLTKEKALSIFNAPDKISTIAKQFNINGTTVRDIKTGKCWSNVTGKFHPSKLIIRPIPDHLGI